MDRGKDEEATENQQPLSGSGLSTQCTAEEGAKPKIGWMEYGYEREGVGRYDNGSGDSVFLDIFRHKI